MSVYGVVSPSGPDGQVGAEGRPVQPMVFPACQPVASGLAQDNTMAKVALSRGAVASPQGGAAADSFPTSSSGDSQALPAGCTSVLPELSPSSNKSCSASPSCVVCDFAGSCGLYFELLSFLPDRRKEARALAARGVSGYSLCEEFRRYASVHCTSLVRQLLRRIGDDSLPETSREVMKALVNLSDLPRIENAILAAGGVARVMANLRDQSNGEAPRHEEVNLMLLANLTRTSAGQAKFLQLSAANGEQANASATGLFITRILALLLEPVQPAADANLPDKALYGLNVLVNITTHAEGRRLLVNDNLLAFTNLCSQLCPTTFRNSASARARRRSLILRICAHLCASSQTHRTFAGEDCDVLPRLGCLVYPPKNSKLRDMEGTPAKVEGLYTADKAGNLKTVKHASRTSAAPGGSEECCSPSVLDKTDIAPQSFGAEGGADKAEGGSASTATDVTAPSKTAGVHRRSRNLPPCVESDAFGLVEEADDRKLVFQCFIALAKTADGRSALRRHNIYEIFRLWHLLESDNSITTAIEDMIHLLVYSEEELAQQDSETQGEAQVPREQPALVPPPSSPPVETENDMPLNDV
eukprot:GHVT01020220.1.p1 GENE.GHVT01020220.1~~GHVT01020220.1.p1  ORF type:complete len:586 (-),score=80.33 GHVT01020220.1:508-2265(-)